MKQSLACPRDRQGSQGTFLSHLVLRREQKKQLLGARCVLRILLGCVAMTDVCVGNIMSGVEQFLSKKPAESPRIIFVPSYSPESRPGKPQVGTSLHYIPLCNGSVPRQETQVREIVRNSGYSLLRSILLRAGAL